VSVALAQQQALLARPAPALAGTWRYWRAATIARITGCPVTNVARNWPLIDAALDARGIADRPVCMAAIGTVDIETAHTFAPVREAFWLSEAWRQTNLRYYPYYGRGFVQLTWESNYRRVGDVLGVDLVGNPDLALDPRIAADALALYFWEHDIEKAARAQDWPAVRVRVQGGYDSLDRLIAVASALDALRAPVETRYVFPIPGFTGPIELHWGTYPGASDLFAPPGAPVVAMCAGTVVYREEWGQVGGNAVQISGEDGNQYYLAHGDRPPAVRMGRRVEAGAYLFGVGDTGNATGGPAHLHIGIGPVILAGVGPTGGAGSDHFDAIGLLRRVRGDST
jgi:hypothetical protein